MPEPTDLHEAAQSSASAVQAERADWLGHLEAVAEETGYVEPLGAHHWAVFTDDTPTLLVTFERADVLRASGPATLPEGLVLAQARGWSHLGLLAEGETWFRDAAIYRYFDRLVDDAFFEDFDRVVFYGAGMGGYAACAFSVVAPGATVVAIAPRATLDPSRAGWDGRHRAHRRLSFNDRYGYAPDMIEGAGSAFMIYDPVVREDAMHAALFARPYVAALKARHFGQEIELALRRMGILDDLVAAAMDGSLTPALFASMMRIRRNYGPYLRRLLTAAQDAGRPALEARICRSVTARMKAPAFRKRLAEIEAGQ